jgi:hypothetical protein
MRRRPDETQEEFMERAEREGEVRWFMSNTPPLFNISKVSGIDHLIRKKYGKILSRLKDSVYMNADSEQDDEAVILVDSDSDEDMSSAQALCRTVRERIEDDPDFYQDLEMALLERIRQYSDVEIDAFVQCGLTSYNKSTTTGEIIPNSMVIRMPPKDGFVSKVDYLNTLLHESVHATAEEIGRKPFGKTPKAQYAYEEFVAEIGSVMVCAQLGIPFMPAKNASYIDAFKVRDVLKEEPEVFFAATREAQKAADMIVTPELIESVRTVYERHGVPASVLMASLCDENADVSISTGLDQFIDISGIREEFEGANMESEPDVEMRAGNEILSVVPGTPQAEHAEQAEQTAEETTVETTVTENNEQSLDSDGVKADPFASMFRP